MIASRRVRTTILPGGRIEITAPEFPAGATVEVTVHPVADESERPSILDVLAHCRGGVLFRTPEDVDAHLREERDSWDR
jgi:hypothetical protein